MNFNKEDLIKSPLNYTGGKFKLLPQILPLFPNEIDTFVDLFGGGFNVGINVNADKYVYNDICIQVVDLLDKFKKNNFDFIHNKILGTIDSYGLSRSDLYGYEKYGCNSNDGLSSYNKEKYLKLRDYYNKNPDWIKFYTLITCSFSNQIRFNSKQQFNMPYGKRDYNVSIQEKLKGFVDKLNKIDVKFICKNFMKFDDILNQNDFIYVDPPYLNSVATYNESGKWNYKNEKELLEYLDSVNSKNIKFALSNNLKYKNEILDKWKEKYNVHYLNGDYSNCNYQKKDKSKDIEILITNY